MTIQLTEARIISGSVAAAGSQHTLDAALEADLVQQGFATWVGGAPNSAGATGLARWNATGTALVDPVSGLPVTRGYQKKVHSIKGDELIDFGLSDFLPSGASFSGAGTYASAGRVAVQSTGTVVHNPTGWHDGTPCIEFTPNADAAELRLYFDNASTAMGHAKLNFNSIDGIACEFEITDVDTSKTNFGVSMEFSNDAVSTSPANKANLNWFKNDSTGTAQSKEFKGCKYYRFRFDSLTTAIKSSAFPGYGYTAVSAGTGADWTKPVNYLKFGFGKFSGKTIKIKRLLLGGYSTPCIVFGTDNASPSALSELMMPLVLKQRIAFYANQYWSVLDSQPTYLERYRRMYTAGVELDGNDVVDRALGDTVLDQSTMAAAIQTTRARQISEGWQEGCRVWVANNNSTSYLMNQELAAAGYVANRTGGLDGRYCFPEGGIPDPYRIPAEGIDGKFLADIQPMIDRCEEYGATMWMYFHNVWSKAQIDADRTNNITGTAGAPIAVNAGENPAAYRARAVGLGTAVGNATVTYLDARIGATASLATFYEDLKEIVDYIATREAARGLVTRRPSDWCRDVGLL